MTFGSVAGAAVPGLAAGLLLQAHASPLRFILLLAAALLAGALLSWLIGSWGPKETPGRRGWFGVFLDEGHSLGTALRRRKERG